MLVTPLYAGLLAIWFFLLSLRVVQQRGHGVSLGDGGDSELLRRIRGHGNFAEYVPLILLMMALLELTKHSTLLLHAMGLTLLVARVLHGVALSYTGAWKFGRFYGTLLTFALLLIAGLLCVWQGIVGLRLQ
ncbi:MAG: MAPEG family protein [Stagnimonas sp.]|nr:MAPEG family protein [Stagnimonas sp.]